MVSTKRSISCNSEEKWRKLVGFAKAHPIIAYDDDLKKEFVRTGKAALKELAQTLESTNIVENCEISYNKGGIAVSGDFHLKGDFKEGFSFDLFFNLDGFNSAICYRRTKGKTDYTGFDNRWISWDSADLINMVRRILLLEQKQQEEALPQGLI
jgi:hypothetical protein